MYFSAGDNQLSGTLPVEWGNIRFQTLRMAYGNKFVTTLPAEWGQDDSWSGLLELDLSGVGLVGAPPPLPSHLTYVTGQTSWLSPVRCQKTMRTSHRVWSSVLDEPVCLQKSRTSIGASTLIHTLSPGQLPRHYWLKTLEGPV